MPERLDRLMETVRAGLADLPAEPVRRALEYYEEYIADALEAGRSEEEILGKLGGAEEIIALIRAEDWLARAEKNPGPIRLTGAARKAVGGAASLAAKITLVIGASVPYTLAMGLYLCAGGAFLCAVAAVGLMAYGITEISPVFVRERIGTAGMAVFSAAVFAAVGLSLWLAGNGITRVTLRVLRRILRRGLDQERIDGGKPPTAKAVTALRLSGFAALLGLGLLVPSGLPFRYFSIWNSMKPGHLVIRTRTYRAAEVRAIEVSTLNSMIALRASEKPEAIRVSYEEPDWMVGGISLRQKKLIFVEESRRRLPFLEFVAMHEGTTAVTIEIPRGYRAGSFLLRSRGGHVSIAAPAAGSIRVLTYNGNVRFDTRGGSFAIRAATKNGRILVKGDPVEGGVYSSGAGAEKTVEIESTGGTVEIE